MAGSGLKDLLCFAFTPNSVNKISGGNACSRAVRGHVLLHTTLVQIIFEGVSFTPEEQQEIMIILRSQEEWISEKVSSNTTLTCVQEKLNNELSRLKDNWPTAALWWVGGARTATAICLSLEVFACVHFMCGEQHVDFRVSRINRDYQDRGKLAQWLADHPPFAVRDSIMSLSSGQENFLANEMNKTKLIELLLETLTAREIEVSTATGDAAFTPPDRNEYFVKTGRGDIEDKSTRQLQELPFSGSILFIHSFTGCDTTCAILNKRKLSILKCFLSMSNEKAIADIFYDSTSTPDAVAQTGEEMFLTVYQAPPSERDLNNNRYNSFVKSSTKVKANLASITKVTAKQHPIRVYLQTQQWLDNDSLDP
ncbi:hypothetical protein PR048_015382 [Dryococelus australis]|uniref:Uncharacterized protein n=1 Tax=Dryococelus australis TaxID=614101 RepID=A0ABQ9HHT9_9NEOP|nr:hypothetical protein PR048_015382 [Dryococelus australis]